MRIHIICLLFLALLTANCGRSSGSGTDSTSVAAQTDADTLSSPYLAWHNLRGPVSECIIEMTGAYMEGARPSVFDEGATTDTLRFGTDGRLLAWVSSQRFADGVHLRFNLHFNYDADGRPIPGTDTSIEPPMELHLALNAYGEPTELAVCLPDGDFNSSAAFTESYEWADGCLMRTELRADELVRRTRFQFPPSSTLPTGALIESDDIEERQTNEESYNYTDFDAYGNWTRREVMIRTSARRYEGTPDQNTERIQTITHRVDTRRITYYGS